MTANDVNFKIVTYTYDCGCKRDCGVEEVLNLEIEPNWGCVECGRGDRVVDIKIREDKQL